MTSYAENLACCMSEINILGINMQFDIYFDTGKLADVIDISGISIPIINN